jgi:transposase
MSHSDIKACSNQDRSNSYVLGIDIAKHKHEAVITDDQLKPIGKTFSFANTREGFNKLLAELSLRNINGDPLKVGLESTGHYGQHVKRFLEDQGYLVYQHNPLETQELAKHSIRKVKNDKVDAFRIAKITATKKHPAFKPSAWQLELRILTRFAFRLQRQLNHIQEQIINLLDGICPELGQLFPQFFQQKTPLRILDRWPDLRSLDRVKDKTFIEFLRKSSRGHIKQPRAELILHEIRCSLGANYRSDYSAQELDMLLKQYRLIEEHLKVVTGQAITKAKTHKDFNWINSVIGISQRMTAVILAEIGEISRFSKGKQITAMAGLDPSVKQSGKYIRKQGNHISKRGSKYLRREMYLAAKAAIMHDPELKAWYEKKKAQGKHYNVCMCAIARKLLLRVWKVWQEQRQYEVRDPDGQEAR